MHTERPHSPTEGGLGLSFSRILESSWRQEQISSKSSVEEQTREKTKAEALAEAMGEFLLKQPEGQLAPKKLRFDLLCSSQRR